MSSQLVIVRSCLIYVNDHTFSQVRLPLLETIKVFFLMFLKTAMQLYCIKRGTWYTSPCDLIDIEEIDPTNAIEL